AILGAGAWGSAIASVLDVNNHHVILWCHEPEVAYEITTSKTNKMYIPTLAFSQNITATTDLYEAVTSAEWIFEALPVKFLRSIVEKAKPHVPNNAKWVILSKGIEQETLFLPSQIIEDVLKKTVPHVVLAGPNFAHELVEKLFTASFVASANHALAQEIAAIMRNTYFKPVLSDDPIGTQVAGALKNVLALISGIAYGSGYKENTVAYLLTQGLKEIAHLAHCFGGKRETAYDLPGLGDMILTCTGTLSKNLKAGRFLARNCSLEELSLNFQALPEGINTIQSLYQLIKQNNLDLPLCKAAYEFIFQNKPFSKFLTEGIKHE
ncbi:MAG: NAD(P)H-dependent glycerol-3-phosphate dehydrogenase, partial [bacterium]